MRPAKTYWMTDILLLSIVLAAFYALWLGSYPLFTPDEGRYAEVAREMLASGDFITPRVNGIAFLDKPVLYYWLQAAAMACFGVTEWAIRFFPALFGVMGCLITYTCGRLLFDRKTAIYSTLILASSPLYFIGAHYANLDLEVAVLITATLLFFITGIQTQGRTRASLLMLSYFAAALAFLTKGLIGIAFPAMIIGAWIIIYNQWSILKNIHLFKGILLFLAITLPWYSLVQNHNPDFLHYFFVTQQFSRFLSQGSYNNQTTFWFYLPVLLIGFFPWSAFLIRALPSTIAHCWRNKNQTKIEAFLLLWISIIFIFFSIPHAKIVTYILPLFPPAALITGRFLALKYSQLQEKNISWEVMLLILFQCLVATLLILMIRIPNAFTPAAFAPYLVLLSAIMLTSAIATYFFRLQPIRYIVAICFSTMVLFLLTLTYSAPGLNHQSAKILANQLKPLLRPEDVVINYHRFYQDVPLYLGRRISIVADWNSPSIAHKDNWQRELWYGMPFQPTKPWLMDDKTFWEKWSSTQRVYVFMKKDDLPSFNQAKTPYRILNEDHSILLIINADT